MLKSMHVALRHTFTNDVAIHHHTVDDDHSVLRVQWNRAELTARSRLPSCLLAFMLRAIAARLQRNQHRLAR